MAAIVVTDEPVELPDERSDRPTVEPGELLSIAKDAHAPLTLFGRTGADVVEELVFRAMLLVAAAITSYGVYCAF